MRRRLGQQFAAAALLGSALLVGCSPGHSTHPRLYQTIQLFGTTLTTDRADELVGKIADDVHTKTADAVNLSDDEAEEIAISFARAKMDPNLWLKATSFSVSMVRFKPSAFPSSDLSTNVVAAAKLLSSAFEEPYGTAARMLVKRRTYCLEMNSF